MYSYLLVYLSLGSLRIFAGSKRSTNHFFAVLASCLLVVWVGFRYKVGCDWQNYELYAEKTWQNFNEMFSARDPLFHLLVEVILKAGFDFYPTINVVTAIIFFGGSLSLAKYTSDRVSFIIYLFPVAVVGLAMSAIRQAIALGIIMFALDALFRYRLGRFFAYVIVAAAFHSSASIFALILPFALNISRNYKIMLLILISIPIGYLIFTSDQAALAVDRYVDTSVEAFGAIFRLLLLAITGAGFLFVFRRRWYVYRRGTYDLALAGSLGTFVLLAASPFSSVIADRMGYYLIPIVALIQAEAPSLYSRGHGKMLALGFFSLYLFFFVNWMRGSSHFYGCYLPYQMI